MESNSPENHRILSWKRYQHVAGLKLYDIRVYTLENYGILEPSWKGKIWTQTSHDFGFKMLNVQGVIHGVFVPTKKLHVQFLLPRRVFIGAQEPAKDLLRTGDEKPKVSFKKNESNPIFFGGWIENDEVWGGGIFLWKFGSPRSKGQVRKKQI